jgi:hypothetical protein
MSKALREQDTAKPAAPYRPVNLAPSEHLIDRMLMPTD